MTNFQLGLDCGIASIGWALIEPLPNQSGRIIAAGTRMFDPPETAKERRPKNELRRTQRGQRRVIHRRGQRMATLRRLFHQHGLLPQDEKHSLKRPGLNPWNLRAAGLDRLLSAEELAVALGHVARHRGFRSNAKNRSNEPDEESKMKKAMAETQVHLSRWRTVGEMLTNDPIFSIRRRNREGDYSRTPLRLDLEAETRRLFNEQRRLQNSAATHELEAEFSKIAFDQRGFGDSEDKVAFCAFEPEEKRTAKKGYSFELFRYLSRLANLKIGTEQRRLTPLEMQRAVAGFGSTKKISYKALRKLTGLTSDQSFATVKPDEENRDVVARHGEAAAGTGTLFNILEGSAWESLLKTPEKIDRIAEIISFRSDAARIRQGLEDVKLEPIIIDTLMTAAEAGTFEKFTGAGHISAKACRNITPHLLLGVDYARACKENEYDHTASRESNAFKVDGLGKHALSEILKNRVIDQSLVGSPVARKALLEAVKQVKAIVEEYGLPDQINVELARDVGRSIEERNEIESGIEKRNKTKEKLRQDFIELLPGPPPNAEELLRYELWLQQNSRCIYSDALGRDAYIDPRHLRINDKHSGDRKVEVDHILPWSRFNDDSFDNKTLCFAKANQEKRRDTPFEWLGKDQRVWATYTACVQGLTALKRHKRKLYLLQDAEEFAKKFSARNLNDTRWASRLLVAALKSMYPNDGKVHVAARPGAITNRLRIAWGLQWFKKDARGKRVPDDRHHALDAIIVAATTERQLQLLTEAFKRSEEKGEHRDFRAFGQPWLGFRDQAIATVEKIFVSRAEHHRARGKAHDATIKQVRKIDGKDILYERKAVVKLTKDDLENIPVPEPYGKIADPKKLRDELVSSLATWIEAGSPKDSPPLSPKGDPIRKVRLKTTDKVGVEVRGGSADRGEMVRIDVFRKLTKKNIWQHFLVPIYPHEIAGKGPVPNRAVPGELEKEDWPGIGAAEFLFSIRSMSLLEVTKPDGEVILAYFRSLDRSTGAINLSPHENITIVRRSIGARTLLSFKKFTIDRLGRKFEVSREVRTWRGKACT